jgi:hypothetical protein
MNVRILVDDLDVHRRMVRLNVLYKEPLIA